MTVGIGTATFEVPPGTEMAGFSARVGSATGTHDELSARAIIFSQSIGILAIDVCILHETTCEQIRRFGQENLGLRDVVVSATHTHSGPCVSFDRAGEHDAAVHENLLMAAQRALTLAHKNSQVATAKWVEVHDLGIAHDRRKNVPLDIPLQSVRFYDAEGLVFAVFVTFACHPVVLDGLNRLISADYPWAVRMQIKEHFPEAEVVFMTGAAGEINTGHSAMASITALGAADRSFARAEEIGRTLGQAACGEGAYLPLADPVFASENVSIPYRNTHRDSQDMGSWEGRVSALRIGELALIFLPGEPFYAWANPMTQAIPSAQVMVLGYSDGVPGYFPSPQAYEEGGYEVELAHEYYGAPAAFDPQCSVILSEAAIAAVKQVYKQ